MRITVEPVLMICMMATMGEYTLVQHLVNVQLCSQQLNLTDLTDLAQQCDRNQSAQVKENISSLQLQAMRNYNLFLLMFPLVTTTIGASWSDKFGRRFTMLIPAIGSLIVQIVLYISSLELAVSDILYPIWMCATLSGLSGTSASVIVSCHGYICDHVPIEQLTKQMTFLEASMFIGGFLGYNLVARLLQWLPLSSQFKLGFALIACLHVINILFTIFWVEEPNFIPKCSLQELFKWDHLKQVWITITKSREHGVTGRTFAMLYFCSLLSFCALAVQQFLMFTYVRDPPFNWNSSDYGYFSGVNFIVNGVSLLCLFPLFYHFVSFLLKKWLANSGLLSAEDDQATTPANNQDVSSTEWKTKRRLIKTDLILCCLGFVSKMFGLLLLGLAQSSVTLMLVPVVLILNEFAMPSIRSVISKLVDKQEKGKALSILSILQITSFFFGSILFNWTFKVTHLQNPGFTFQVVSAAQLIAIIILGVLAVRI